jgi:hypothetical protein
MGDLVKIEKFSPNYFDLWVKILTCTRYKYFPNNAVNKDTVLANTIA